MFGTRTSILSIRALLATGLACFGFIFDSSAGDLVPLQIKLPNAAALGTPSDNQLASNADPNDQPRPPLMVPPGVSNVALGKTVTSSATNARPAQLAKITDGEKEAEDENILMLNRGVQWVQIDLGAPQEIYAVVCWHAHNTPKVCHGVVVQVADNAEFTKSVRTLFNNDRNNGDGRGAGTDREYFETKYGKLIEGRGTKARYVRLYSHGSTEGGINYYTEVEVYGRPAR
jgi:hypothetical protein